MGTPESTPPETSATAPAPASPPSHAPGFATALAFPFRGMRLVFVTYPSLARYWLPPLLVSASALVGIGYWSFGAAADMLGALWSAPTGAVAGFLHAVVVWVLRGLMFAAGAALVAALGGVIAAPFNDALSHALERRLTDRPVAGDPSLRAVLRDLGQTLRLELRKLGLYALVMLPAALASFFVPVVGPPLYSIAGFVFTAAYFALDYVDWPAARRGWPARARLSLLRRYPGTMLGFGVGVWLLLWVPLLNLLFMPAAVAGGTLLFLSLPESAAAPPTAG